MKLSAPLPPPVADAPGSPTPGASETPVADAPGSPPAAPAPKVVVWPAWFSGVDAALVGLVLVFAFLAASFVARNSDVWLNLAAGKRLAAGEYVPGGGDPFSYSASGRTWVNHSWLADAGAYLLYSIGAGGKALVAAKALLVALTFGLLMALRRPRFALWPWAACACVAVLAAVPQFTLRPLVVSLFLLAGTLFLLFGMPHRKGSWRFPVAVGVTFWVWANCDQWFFLGPLALALLVIGDLIQKYGFNAPAGADGDPDADALGRLPDTATLAKALAVGVLACTLTPHHVLVWQLPFELTGANGIDADGRLKQMLLTPYDNLYFSTAGLGGNVHGLAYAVLFVAGAAVIGLSAGRLRTAHVALWLGFAALSMLSIYAVPFFALVAVPLVASQLNAFGARTELKTWGDPRTRLLVLGASGGRVLSVLAVCLLCALAYPGWVHPEPSSPAFARRVAWGVEPDPLLVQAAGQFETWRETDALPADARGMIANLELANHVAWFAPREKVFVNGNLEHHRAELADFVAVRKGLGLFTVKDEPPNPADAADVLAKRGADYVAASNAPTDAVRRLYLNWGAWSVWYTDGRTAVFGWHPAGGKPGFANLRLDATAKAFGPGVAKVPEPDLKQPLTQPSTDFDQTVAAYLRAPQPAPAGAAEALGWVRYKQALLARRQVRAALAERAFFASPAAGNTFHSVAILGAAANNALRFAPRYAGDEADAMRAAPLLALRAARRAISENPDHPDAYHALAQALRDPDLPLTDSERALGIVTALRQCLERLPKPDLYNRGEFAASGMLVAVELADAYAGRRYTWRDPATRKEAAAHTGFPVDIPVLRDLLGQAILLDPRGPVRRVPAPLVGQALAQSPRGTQLYADGTPHLLPIDLAYKALQRALEYAPADTAGESGEQGEAARKALESQLREVEDEASRYTGQFNAAKRPGVKLPALVQGAIQNCLIGQALDLLGNKDIDLAKEYEQNEPFAAVTSVALELAAGRIENAAELLAALSSPQSAAALERAGLAPAVQELKYQKALQAGEYKAAGDLAAALESRVPGMAALLARFAEAGINPNKLLLAELGRMPPPVPGGGLLASFFAVHFLGERYDQVRTARDAVAAKMQQDARYCLRRGELALLEGDIPAAKAWFQQSRRDPPPGWRLGEQVPLFATVYLELIARAAR